MWYKTHLEKNDCGRTGDKTRDTKKIKKMRETRTMHMKWLSPPK